MELRRYARLLRQRILLIALAVVVGLGAGYLTANRVHHYRTVATIYVGSRQFAGIANSTDATGAMDRLTATFAAMIKSTPTATAALQLTHAPRTADQVVAETIAVAVPSTNYILVVLTDTDPAVAQTLANGVAAGFVSQVQGLEPGTGGAGSPPVTSVFQQAARPTSPLPTSTRSRIALGGGAGLAAGLGLVGLLNYLDISVKNPQEVEALTGVPVLGTIPALPRSAVPSGMSNRRSAGGRRAPRDAGPGAAFEDAFQVLQAGLSGAVADMRQPRVMVTSPSGGEGRTTTCVNLARGYAATGLRVVLLDLDLRHPDAHRLIGAHNDFGVSDLVLERRTPEDCLQFVSLAGPGKASGGLYFLGTGPVGDNPARLLGMDRTSKILDLIAGQADLVLIDTPPVLTVADALVIGRMVSGALLVVQAHRTVLGDIGRANDLLVRNHTEVLGVVLNRFDRRDQGYWEPSAGPVDPSGVSG